MGELILPFADQYEPYLRDESRAAGHARYIAFPETDDDLARALDFASGEGVPVTIQGARTGLDGGAVPHGGLIVSCERLRGITAAREREDGALVLTACAGTTMLELNQYLAGYARERGGRFFWPGSPSEDTATVAGAVSGGASGVFAYRYGGARDNAAALETAGGVVRSAELILLPAPAAVWGVAFFFRGEDGAFEYAMSVRPETEPDVAALDLLDAGALRAVMRFRKISQRAAELPEIDAGFHAAVYAEIHAAGEDAAVGAAERLFERASRFGADEDYTWAARGEGETARVRSLRHIAQEAALYVHDTRAGARVRTAGVRFDGFGRGEYEKLRALERELAESGIETAAFGCPAAGRVRLYALAAGGGEYARAAEVIWL